LSIAGIPPRFSAACDIRPPRISGLHYRPARWCVANADVRPPGGRIPASIIATIRCREPASAGHAHHRPFEAWLWNQRARISPDLQDATRGTRRAARRSDRGTRHHRWRTFYALQISYGDDGRSRGARRFGACLCSTPSRWPLGSSWRLGMGQCRNWWVCSRRAARQRARRARLLL